MSAPSVRQMIKLIAGLSGTMDVDERTSDFIDRVVELTEGGQRTSRLSGPQAEWVFDIWRRHFG